MRHLYPIMINLEDRLVVVIGGGGVALRKVRDLIDAGARVKVIAPEVHEEIQQLAAGHRNRLQVFIRGYEPGDLAGAALVFSAANEPQINRNVFAEAQQRHIFINAVDDPPNCSFFIPSFTRRGSLILSISTSGASPAMAARLRRQLEKHVPENADEVLECLSRARELLITQDRFRHLSSKARGALLKRIVADDRLLDRLCSCDRSKTLPDFLQQLLKQP